MKEQYKLSDYMAGSRTQSQAPGMQRPSSGMAAARPAATTRAGMVSNPAAAKPRIGMNINPTVLKSNSTSRADINNPAKQKRLETFNKNVAASKAGMRGAYQNSGTSRNMFN